MSALGFKLPVLAEDRQRISLFALWIAGVVLHCTLGKGTNEVIEAYLVSFRLTKTF